jgi:hypothetical protein
MLVVFYFFAAVTVWCGFFGCAYAMASMAGKQPDVSSIVSTIRLGYTECALIHWTVGAIAWIAACASVVEKGGAR